MTIFRHLAEKQLIESHFLVDFSCPNFKKNVVLYALPPVLFCSGLQLPVVPPIHSFLCQGWSNAIFITLVVYVWQFYPCCFFFLNKRGINCTSTLSPAIPTSGAQWLSEDSDCGGFWRFWGQPTFLLAGTGSTVRSKSHHTRGGYIVKLPETPQSG